MNEAELREILLRLLCDIAPEIVPDQVDPDAGFRDQFDLDSMDFQNFIIAIDKELHIAIPERDYEKLSSLNACVNHLRTKL